VNNQSISVSYRMNTILRTISRNELKEVLPSLPIPKKDLTKYSNKFSNKSDVKVFKRKIPNLVIKLKNERFLVSQNKIEMINNNSRSENNNEIKNFCDELSERVNDNPCLDPETSQFLEEFLKSNPEVLISNACAEDVCNVDVTGDTDVVDEFQVSHSELANLPRNFDQLEKEVFEGLSIFDNIEDLEEIQILQTITSTSNTRLKGERKNNSGLKVIYDCRSCSKVFMTWHELNMHEQEHDKTIVCEICDKSFRKENYLESHKDIHKCCVCGQFGQLVGMTCKNCDGRGKITSVKSMSKKMKESRLWKKKTTINLNKFLLKNRSFNI